MYMYIHTYMHWDDRVPVRGGLCIRASALVLDPTTGVSRS